MRKPRLRSSIRRVNKLLALLEGRQRVLVMIHDHPDPDAMAGAFCLSHLVESRTPAKARIVYGGMIGRTENRNMVRSLDIPLWSVESITFRPDDAVIMVDTQPAFANHSLPSDWPVLAVIDHHPGEVPAHADLLDIRPRYGAVTTILTEYLVSAGVEIPPRVATAICYGINTETQDLGREASGPDIAAFLEAFLACDQRLLGRLRHPRRSISFFPEMDHAIRSARVVEHALVCHLGAVPTRDTPAEMADILATIEGVDWVLCTGVHEALLAVSVRTTDEEGHAGRLLRGVIGQKGRAGGHGMIAGGSLAVEDGADPSAMHDALVRRFLEALGCDGHSSLTPLLELPGVRRAEELDSETGGKR